MAKKLKVGDVIRGYRITKVFGPGMMAISYAARSPSGGPVFLKQTSHRRPPSFGTIHSLRINVSFRPVCEKVGIAIRSGAA